MLTTSSGHDDPTTVAGSDAFGIHVMYTVGFGNADYHITDPKVATNVGNSKLEMLNLAPPSLIIDLTSPRTDESIELYFCLHWTNGKPIAARNSCIRD